MYPARAYGERWASQPAIAFNPILQSAKLFSIQ